MRKNLKEARTAAGVRCSQYHPGRYARVFYIGSANGSEDILNQKNIKTPNQLFRGLDRHI